MKETVVFKCLIDDLMLTFKRNCEGTWDDIAATDDNFPS